MHGLKGQCYSCLQNLFLKNYKLIRGTKVPFGINGESLKNKYYIIASLIFKYIFAIFIICLKGSLAQAG